MKNDDIDFYDIPNDKGDIKKYENVLKIFKAVKYNYKQRNIFTNEQLYEIEKFLLKDNEEESLATYYDRVLIKYINLLTEVENKHKKPSKNKLLNKLESMAFVILSNSEYKNILETDQILRKYNIQRNIVEIIEELRKCRTKTDDTLCAFACRYRECLIDILEIKKQMYESEQEADIFKLRLKKSKKIEIIELVNKHNYSYKRVADILNTTEQYVKNTMSSYRKKL